MTLLLELREKLKQIYARYSTFLLPVFKFILAFAILKGINSSMGQMEALDNIFLLLILSLICSILPLNLTVFFGIVFVIVQCYGVGIEVAGFAAALMLILFILYLRFTPGDALILLLTPMAFQLGIPCAVPIGYGLAKEPASTVSAGCGVIVYYFIDMVDKNASMFRGADPKEMAQNLKILLDGILKNQEMLLQVIAFVAVLLIVNVIRRRSVDYAWQIAIFAGGISYIVIIAAGGLMLDVKNPIVPLLAGAVGAVVVAEVLEFFLFHVDYSRTEHLQFEDDEYYYYVKAVPKMSIAGKNVTVKTIGEAEIQPGPVPQETIAFTGLQKQLNREETISNPVEEPGEEVSQTNVDYESRLEESLKDL